MIIRDSNFIFTKTASITDNYDVDWDHKLGTGISGPVRVGTKRSTGEKFAIKVVIDRPKARQEVCVSLGNCFILYLCKSC